MKAGAMAYALIICVILGIFLGTILLLQSNSRFLQDKSFIAQELIATNEAASDFYMNDFGNNPESINKSIDILNNGMFSSGKIKNWGFYKIGIITTVFKNDSISKIYLLGENPKEEDLALYLTDYDKPLNMVGLAKITGNAKLPRSGIKRGNVFNGGQRSSVILDGQRLRSTKKLPRLKDEIYFEDNFKEMSLAALNPEEKLHNSFVKPVIHVKSDVRNVSNRNFQGNIILKSNDTLVIDQTNQFEDIVIQAPMVVFEEGFVGNVQVYAEHGVYLEQNAILKYPSSIYVDGNNDFKTEVFIGKDAKVLGGIVLTGNEYRQSLQRLLTIEEGGLVVGDVFCYGKTQLKGNVFGTVFTDRFYLKTETTIYENYIQNGTINKEELPSYFVRLPLFENNDPKVKYEIVKSI